MDVKEFKKIIRKAEKQISIKTRTNDRLLSLRRRVEILLKPSMKKEDWLEIRKLARHGKRIATWFGDHEMRKYFGGLFNTASTYLDLHGDSEQREEAYALI